MNRTQGVLLPHTSPLGTKGGRGPSQLLVFQVRPRFHQLTTLLPCRVPPAPRQLISQHSGHPLCDSSHPGIFPAPHWGHWAGSSQIATSTLKSQLTCTLFFEPHLQVQLLLNISLASLRLSVHKNDYLITVPSLSYYHFPPYSAKSPQSIFILISYQTLLTALTLSPFSMRPSFNLG